MLPSLGPWEILLILFVVLLFFGAKRLPEIGGALGKGIREFKRSMREIESELQAPVDEPRRSVTSGSSGAPQAEESKKLEGGPPD
ncbi:MAG: twin-arginine translocase TatA/TatE family subunit [Gemmatimonadetes bacterium]|nr:twin-arginine translocase TatA/TatE family subunit [Gemmatimonadota bacterium]